MRLALIWGWLPRCLLYHITRDDFIAEAVINHQNGRITDMDTKSPSLYSQFFF